jgi:uncharacterized protein YggE
MRLARIAVLAAAGLAVAAFAGVLQPGSAVGQAAEPEPGSLTVIGSGGADVTPDRASFGFGTVTQARTAAAALDASSAAVARVVAALRREGIAQADIQTADVSLSPRWSENGESIIGYTASNTVTAIIRRLGQAGAVIDAAVAAGANQMSGPSLLASDQASAYRDALRAAVANARAKAQTLATASGVTAGRITAVVESGTGPSPMPAQDAERAAAPTIEPGTQRIEATVSVTFAISGGS